MKILGVNIKRLREEKRITLRTLAKSANISPSFLSQIETGKASPSLDTLKNISNSLSTTVGNLIGENHQAGGSPVVRLHERKHLDEIGTGINIYLLTSPDPNKQMEPLLFRLSPKASSGTGMYKHFGQEFVLVLKGTIEITLNDAAYVLRKGDSIFFNSSTPHSFRNAGKDETEAIWVVTPPTF
ncbi:MAG: helix-turn-helix domain-containing protein [Endomicrobiales bacterium]